MCELGKVHTFMNSAQGNRKEWFC